jgi:hypothetical protein
MVRWPPPVYRARIVFRAPLEYVFAWWTDYGPEDGRLGRYGHTRRILSRGACQVVFEDLVDQGVEGWGWTRDVVTLSPPDRWRDWSIGNQRDFDLDYRLRSLGEEQTELVLRGRRRPRMLGTVNPPLAPWERAVAVEWRNFARALEADYRAGRPAAPPPSARRVRSRSAA